jgi:hypothetical protein
MAPALTGVTKISQNLYIYTVSGNLVDLSSWSFGVSALRGRFRLA